MPAAFSRTTRALANDNATGAFIAWACAAVLLGLWLAWAVFGRVTVYAVSDKARLEVRQAARTVTASLASRIVTSNLQLGATVKAGDVLVELDSSSETLRLREEEARLQALGPQIEALKHEIAALERAGDQDRVAARAALQSAQSRVSEAAAGSAFAADNERRLTEQNAAGTVAKIDALRAQSEARKQNAAKSALESELRRQALDAQTRGHQQRAQIESLNRNLAALQGELATTTASVARLAGEIDKHRIRAPIDGRVGDVLPLRAGEYVQAGQKLATVVPSGDLIVVADFAPAAVLGKVHPGQSARLRLDGFPWTQFGSVEATVTRVASEIRDGLVRVEFTPPRALPAGIHAQHGLPGSVEVSVEEVAPAWLVLRATGQRLSAAASPVPTTAEPSVQ